jgi:hypothetical protein
MQRRKAAEDGAGGRVEREDEGSPEGEEDDTRMEGKRTKW